MLPYPILFGRVYMYGIMIALGILACIGLLYLMGKKKNVDPAFTDFMFYNGIVAIVVGFVAAALFQATYNYIEDPSAGFHIGQGITFIGGLIGGAASFLGGYFLLGRRPKYKSGLLDAVTYIPSCILLAHAFGRVGCFFAGCCGGKPTDSIFGVRFPAGSPPAYDYPEYGEGHAIVGSVPVHPTQLYEAVFLLLLCLLFLWLVLKFDFKYCLALYFGAYGIFRFLIEYLRGDDRGSFVGSLSPSQFWSVVMVAAGVGTYFLLRYLYARRAARGAE